MSIFHTSHVFAGGSSVPPNDAFEPARETLPAIPDVRLRLTRTRLATVVALLLLATPLARLAQQAAKTPRLGFLQPSSPMPATWLEAFRAGLRDAGYGRRAEPRCRVAQRGGTNGAPCRALCPKHRLPAIYGWREFAEDGGLMVYGVSMPDLWRRLPAYVDKVLKGTKPAELPIEQPTRFELVINRASREG
jgi:hypothetical protein